MLKKEIKGIVKNPIYYIVMILPFIMENPKNITVV